MNMPDRLLIRLGEFEFDPLHDELPASEASAGEEGRPGAETGGPKSYVVQFHEPPRLTDRERVQAEYGLRLTDYVPELSYLERLDPAVADRLSSDPLVRTVVPYGAVLKLSPTLGGALSPQRGRPRTPGLRLSVALFPDARPDRVADSIEGLGGERVRVNDDRAIGGGVVVTCLLPDPEAATRIATLEEVRSIERVAEHVEDSAAAAGTNQTGDRLSRVVWDRGLHGEGQIIGIIDSGPPDIGHCFFEDPNITGNTPDPNHRKVLEIRFPAGTAARDHATVVGSCAAGDDINNLGVDAGRGGAFAARMVFGDNDDIPERRSMLAELNAAAGAGAAIHSNSWHDDTAGAGNPATYNQTAADVDAFTWNNEDHLVLGSAGNQGEEQGPPGTAKNAVCVGAAEMDPNEMNLGDGNPGPTADGRRKPDVVGVGCGIRAADNGTGCGTVLLGCATSWATPHVAAAAALVRQYFTEGFYPTGAANAADAFVPSGALLKAVLINSTVDMTGVTGYPSDDEGWGLIRLDNALYFPGDDRNLVVHDRRNAQGLTTGAVETHRVDVVSASQPLKVVLAWTDFPAAVNARIAAVNNLDLEVVSPDGTQTFRGNAVAGDESADDVNNVEVVVVNDPAPGSWTVRVVGTAVMVGNPGQGYAVAATGAFLTAATVDYMNACVSLLLLEPSGVAAPAADTFSHRAGTVLAGTTSHGTIELAAASPGGKVVRFTSSDPDLVKVPNVQIPAGESKAAFTIQVAAGAAGETVELTAQGDAPRRASVTVPPRGIRTLALGSEEGHRPAVLGLAADGAHVYATHYLDNVDGGPAGRGDLVAIDQATLAEVSRVQVGHQPRSVAVNPQTKRIYVANRGKESFSLSILDGMDPGELKKVAELKLGQGPVDVAVNANTNRAFVANPFQRKIHVIDGVTDAELGSVDVGTGLGGLAIDADSDRLYVVRSHRDASASVRALAIIQGHADGTFEVLPPVPVGLVDSQPVDVAVNVPANRIYVACLGAPGTPPGIAVLARDALAPVAFVRTIANPHAVVAEPGRNQVYVGTDAGLQILDGKTNAIVSTAPKKAPWSVAANPAGGRVFYGAALDDIVSEIPAPDLATVVRWT